MNVGKSVKILLIQRDMNQTDLANKAGTTRAAISYVCSSESCSKSMMDKLCKAFDMKASELIALGE